MLALDLSSTCGFAAGHPGDAAPEFGSWRLTDSKLLAPRFVSFENELLAALDRYKPRLVVVEAPLPAMRQSSSHVARQQFGLSAIADAACWRERVQVREADASAVRKHVLGRGRFPTGTAKSAVMDWCRAKGWPVADDHQADALVLFAYTCEIEARARG